VAAGIDTLVLGCTHYPLLTPILAPIVGPSVRLIDSAHATAAATRRAIEDTGLGRPMVSAEGATPRYRFIVSDAADQFLQAARRFLGATIERVETRTLG
jgi:glutamate racemase